MITLSAYNHGYDLHFELNCKLQLWPLVGQLVANYRCRVGPICIRLEMPRSNKQPTNRRLTSRHVFVLYCFHRRDRFRQIRPFRSGFNKNTNHNYYKYKQYCLAACNLKDVVANFFPFKSININNSH